MGRPALHPIIERDGAPGKCCAKCVMWKPVGEYDRATNGCVGGIRNVCKKCELARQAARYRADPEFRARNIASVIKGQRKRLPGPGVSDEQWTEIQLRFGGLCAYCKTSVGDTMDHVIPISRGGQHSPENVVPCCYACNSGKKARTPEEWAAARTPRSARIFGN